MTSGGPAILSPEQAGAPELDDHEQAERQKGEHGAFSGQPETHTFAGFLFDLDGTLLNTTDAVTQHWNKSVLPLLSDHHPASTRSRLNSDH